ncbi:uncharacterized protein EV420DRAFT_1634958 [Desarmillaria tabescens]|uniref:Uncharacterized protein n=1 Tax=Armillaria tabescens TaxID=1929756 RepID=A0AA39NL95_ARMTA|nr:uncharacterized protein EV420DRAFT_1634958 [Desarmillaria tabescens]KAK0467702.1 hypothetical protein EV420DRAFT_1634958 [Desarmillaria tabescens]
MEDDITKLHNALPNTLTQSDGCCKAEKEWLVEMECQKNHGLIKIIKHNVIDVPLFNESGFMPSDTGTRLLTISISASEEYVDSWGDASLGYVYDPLVKLCRCTCTVEKCNLFYDITTGLYGCLLKPNVWREHAAKDEHSITRSMVDAALAKVKEDEDHLESLLSQVTLMPQSPSPSRKPPSTTKAKKLEGADVYGSIHDQIDEIKAILVDLPDPTALRDMELESIIMLVDSCNNECLSLKQRVDIL